MGKNDWTHEWVKTGPHEEACANCGIYRRSHLRKCTVMTVSDPPEKMMTHQLLSEYIRRLTDSSPLALARLISEPYRDRTRAIAAEIDRRIPVPPARKWAVYEASYGPTAPIGFVTAFTADEAHQKAKEAGYVASGDSYIAVGLVETLTWDDPTD